MEQALVEQPLSQVERVVDTFIAPSKTFTDILRNRSWWLPFLIFFVVSAGFAFAVDRKIGYDAVAEQAMQQSSMAQSQMANLTAEQKAVAVHRQAVATKYMSYVGGVFFLLFALIGALLNWATINFGFGGKTTFGQNFALQMYSSLPMAIKSVISIVLLYAGVGTDNFNMRNPVGTNPGYYMGDAAAWLKSAMAFFDIFGLWSLALAVIGLAIISGKSKGTAAIVVFGWWFVLLLLATGATAAFS